MAILYFLGGEDVKKRDSIEINKMAFAKAGGMPFVVYFPWKARTIDKCRRIISEYFKELGARRVEFVELSDTLEEIVEKVNESDLIYLPGGDTKLLLERLKNAKVSRLLQNYDKVILGNSAGALALCRDCVLTKSKRHLETEIFQGLGLVDFSVDVHYEPSKDEELMRLSKERRIYAIPEKSALIYDKGYTSFIGKVFLFDKGVKSKYMEAAQLFEL